LLFFASTKKVFLTTLCFLAGLCKNYSTDCHKRRRKDSTRVTKETARFDDSPNKLPPRYAPAPACKWWHNIRHVRIWIGRHYCMSMLACQYNQPKRPGDLNLWPCDLESGVRVTCDVGCL